MSTHGREPALLRDFRELYDYVYEVGRHVNLIYKRLERIETKLNEISERFDESTTVNRRDIVDIREKMLTRSEFDQFVDALKAKVEETLPSLPESTSITPEPSKLSAQPETSEQSRPPQEEQQRRGIFG